MEEEESHLKMPEIAELMIEDLRYLPSDRLN